MTSTKWLHFLGSICKAHLRFSKLPIIWYPSTQKYQGRDKNFKENIPFYQEKNNFDLHMFTHN